MAGITITGLAQVLKRQYAKSLTELCRYDEGMFKRLKKLSDYRATGSGYYFSLMVGDDQQAIGAAAEDSTLQDPDVFTAIQGYVVCVYQYATFRITGPAVARAQNGGGFFSDALGYDIKKKRQLLARYLDEQFVRNGDGVCATCVGSGSSATSMIVDTTRHLHRNMKIEVYTTAGGAEITSVDITRINPQTKTLTLEDAGSWTDGSYIYRDGQYNSGTPLEMTGLRQIIDDETTATFQNITVASYPEYMSYVDSDGGAISRERLFKANNFAELFSPGTIQEIWQNRALRNKLFMIIQPAIIFQKPANLELAYNPKDDVLSFENKSFPVDETIFDGDMFGMNWSTIGKIEEKPIGIESIIPGEGSTMLRDSGKDAATGFLSTYVQPVCTNRRGNWKMTGLTTDYSF
uniref:Putative capsid protein n=1 Tax=viral metagenome TaxID=1070528 RepID=A0A6H1ZJ37_9ZZZZ